VPLKQSGEKITEHLLKKEIHVPLRKPHDTSTLVRISGCNINFFL